MNFVGRVEGLLRAYDYELHMQPRNPTYRIFMMLDFGLLIVRYIRHH